MNPNDLLDENNIFAKIIKVQLINNQNCIFISVNHSVKPFSDRGFQVEMFLLQIITCTLGYFYILIPFLGISFGVWVTPSFSLSSRNFILNHSSIGIPSMHSLNFPFSCRFLSTVAVECSFFIFF